LPTIDSEIEWKEYRKTFWTSMHDLWSDFNDYVVSRGVEPLDPKKNNKWCNGSQFLNIYGFPLELDYLDIRPLDKNWIRFDNLMRSEVKEKFEIPPELSDKSGKLIYFSMGSMGGTNLDLISRLISILGKSEHRYVVSKGPCHDEYDLPPNMWGERTVPQIQVLPIVDLVITHGGNNSFTETFYFGKPLIVMPLYIDQYDNAQRVEDKGLGIRLDPYLCLDLLNILIIRFIISMSNPPIVPIEKYINFPDLLLNSGGISNFSK